MAPLPRLALGSEAESIAEETAPDGKILPDVGGTLLFASVAGFPKINSWMKLRDEDRMVAVGGNGL
ncbi:MAG: hypothetical protein IPK78_19285 [Rhodospirillales bacterium]|nr:hypothetical protein [Rhodospirillales bacterium]